VGGWDKVDFEGEFGMMSGKGGLVEPGAAARQSGGLPGAAPGRPGQGNSWWCWGHPQKWCRGRRRRWGRVKGLGGELGFGGRSLEDVIEVGQGGRREGGIGWQRRRSKANAKGFGEVSHSGTQNFSGGGSGHGDLMGEPGKGVGMDSFAGAPSHTGVAAVAFQVRANIPAVDAGGRPGAALAGFLVDDHMSSKRGKRMFVVVIRAMKLGPGRQFRVEPGCAKEVQREDGLGKQKAPMMEWELRVTATKASNEMVLEGLNGALSGIAAVDVGWG